MNSVRPHSTPHKTCSTCGKPFMWRKKWEACWDEVKHCSDVCKTRASQLRKRLIHELRVMAEDRGEKHSFCPSEVAKVLTDRWQEMMPLAREVADYLIERGELICLQRDQRVASAAKAAGPVRLRKASKSEMKGS
jgi:hypothetical protein